MSIDVKSLISNRACPERSVHLGKTRRYDTAKDQLDIPVIDINSIITWTNEFIKAYGLKLFNGNNIIKTENINLFDFNKSIKNIYKEITSNEDIIWMKFTNDNRVGVVACSNDVNFDIPPINIPPSQTLYDTPERVVNGKIKRWKYNTSGILVHSVSLRWDESFFLVFPLIGLEKGKQGVRQRHEIENGIGNYLISKQVPIIDYYSHRI